MTTLPSEVLRLYVRVDVALDLDPDTPDRAIGPVVDDLAKVLEHSTASDAIEEGLTASDGPVQGVHSLRLVLDEDGRPMIARHLFDVTG